MRILRGGLVLVGGAVLAAAPLSMVASGGTASAASPQVAVVCTHLHGNGNTLVAKVKGCTSSTGGHGAIVNFTPGGGNVTWANGTTTDYSSTSTNPTSGCPTGDGIFKITGTVTSGTNPNTPVGQAVKMKICVSSTLVLTNAPGTNVKF